MPKYRSLTTAELAPLEEDFVKFLVLNGLTSEDWVKIKSEDIDQANGIIDAFSDVVFEKILRTNMFLDYVSKKEICSIQFLGDKEVLVGAKAPEGHDFDIDTPLSKPLDGVKVFTIEKPYQKERELSMFDYLNHDWKLSNGSLFKKLCLGL